jgi:hypothetical protein
MKYTLFILALGLTFMSCKKDVGPDPNSPYAQKARELDSTLQQRALQIKDFYAEEPTVYNDTTGVLETELYGYVPYTIRDDSMFISNNVVDIYQGLNKSPFDASAYIRRSYSVTYDNKHVYFNFLSHTYNPQQYILIGYELDGFRVYVPFKKTKIITHYKFL